MTSNDFRDCDEFIRLKEVIRETLVDIAYFSLTDVKEFAEQGDADELLESNKTYDFVENSVDVTFSSIDKCFRDVKFSDDENDDTEGVCLSDTVTRRCAKTAIYQVIDRCKAEKVSSMNLLDFIDSNIDCSDVYEDIVHMCAADENTKNIMLEDRYFE
jgi:hypothetical protein